MAASKKKPAKKLSFGEAVTEVEEILQGLEDDNIDIDKLGEEVRRAVELIQVCRGKLEKTDAEVRQLVEGLQSQDSSEEANTSNNGPSDSEVPF
ncbi:MAG: exodeoxyribonuclease VII small subunit [bacterium]|nr:exodeoxyribonuclease VII small subunit [bacterium]